VEVEGPSCSFSRASSRVEEVREPVISRSSCFLLRESLALLEYLSKLRFVDSSESITTQ